MSYSDVYVCLDCHGLISGEEYEEDMKCPFCDSTAIVESRDEGEMDYEDDGANGYDDENLEDM